MNFSIKKHTLFFIGSLLFTTNMLFAQIGNLNSLQNRMGNGSSSPYNNNGSNQGNRKDTTKNGLIEHRDKYADSITIFYRYYDSTHIRNLDTNINDFSKRIRYPFWYNNLGNFGTASASLIFHPFMQPGWDEGFHQFDAYNFTIENTRFFQTTRPYTELGYLLGKKAEQIVDILHTQNKKDRFNFSFEYRFSNSPGALRTQNASINNLRFTTHYQSPNKRYESFFIFLFNKNAASENGGLRDVNEISDLSGKSFSDAYSLQTRLGEAQSLSANPFLTAVNTGNVYSKSTLLYRHQYDFGQKDSLQINDSTTVKLFYVRLRLQHTFKFESNSYKFKDVAADSTNYDTLFNYTLPRYSDTVTFKDKWNIVTNEFAVLTYPDKKNQSQFLKLGAGIQFLGGKFGDTSSHSYHDIYLMGEYRNRTRNQKWDMELRGQLFANGMHAGDYDAWASLKRDVGKSLGTLELGAENVNRTPSFIFNPSTNFYIENKQNFKKENYTRLFATYTNAKLKLILNGEYYLVNNYSYSDSFFRINQEAALFNVLHVSAEKAFKLSKHFTWYAQAHLQQTTGNPPVHVPLFLIMNRLAYEANFYKNLFLATGVEVRYYTNYKADNYSPFTGQFFTQNTFTTSNLPDVNVFFDFRIKSFKAFVRLENINTVQPSKGYTFNNYNFMAPLYPTQGLWIRVGIWWNFIN